MFDLRGRYRRLTPGVFIGVLIGVAGCANIFDVDKDYRRGEASTGVGAFNPSSSSSSSGAGGSTTTTSSSASSTSSGGQCTGAGDCDLMGADPDCALPVCDMGTCNLVLQTAGTACGNDVCDGAGACVECLDDGDCKGNETCNTADNTCQ